MTGNPFAPFTARSLVVPQYGSVWLESGGDRFTVTHRFPQGTPIHQRVCETRDQAEAAFRDCEVEIGAAIRDRVTLPPLGASLLQPPWTPPNLERFSNLDLILAARAGVLGDLPHWSPDQPVTADIRQGWELMAALSEIG